MGRDSNFSETKPAQLAKAGKTGLDQLTGWWNGLAGRDLDGDGDIDYIATNFGRNTKYHPDPAHPALIYYGDMDGSGKSQIVEAEYEGDNVVPIRGRSCSSLAMPFIKEKFSTYKSFALASLTEIYTPEKLDSVQKFTAATLDSGLLRNDGKGHFTFEPLPWAGPGFPGLRRRGLGTQWRYLAGRRGGPELLRSPDRNRPHGQRPQPAPNG